MMKSIKYSKIANMNIKYKNIYNIINKDCIESKWILIIQIC